MAERAVVTGYPHDRLSRLADAMARALDEIPGTSDVRAVVMLNDAENGCEHAHNYPGPEGRRNALVFIDAAVHIAEMGRALGVKAELLVSGKKAGTA
jgi:hypothetical protein